MLTLCRLIRRSALLAAGVALVGVAPATADVYRWVNADGTIAYTDEAKRVPAAYRTSALRTSLPALTGYSRFTPADPKATSRHAAGLAQRLERLRALNEGIELPAAPSVPVAHQPGPITSLDLQSVDRRSGRRFVGRDARGRPVYRRTSHERIVNVPVPTVALPLDPDDPSPIIVERRRVFDSDTGVTRHITVVEQGGRVVGLIKPRAHAGPIHTGPEEDLER